METKSAVEVHKQLLRDKALFLAFRKQHRIKFRWNSNVARYSQPIVKGRAVLVSTESRLWIAAAFNWSKTPEGYEFWASLNWKWKQTLANRKVMK